MPNFRPRDLSDFWDLSKDFKKVTLQVKDISQCSVLPSFLLVVINSTPILTPATFPSMSPFTKNPGIYKFMEIFCFIFTPEKILVNVCK